MTLGLRIKEVRKDRKMTLKRLGALTNLSASFICDVENGRTNPSVEALQHIAKALETSVAYLFGESDYRDLMPQPVLDTVIALSAVPQGLEILNHLADYTAWSDTDKKELLQYLSVKSLLRNTETGS